MNAKSLIGEVAVRTEPVEYESGTKDYSYSSGKGVKIINATDTHVVIESEYGGKPHILDSRWVNNWIPVESLIKGGMQ